MIKNEDVRKIIVIEVLFLFFAVIGALLLVNYHYNLYKEALFTNNAYVIDAIVSKHPELEHEVIEAITDHELDYDHALEILSTYGLDNVSDVEYLNDNSVIQKKIYHTVAVYIFFVITISLIIFLLYISYIYKKIRGLSSYTNDILNNKFSLDIREYKEGDISNLKNDLYKMTIRLKEQNDLSIKDKKYLQDTLSDISHQLKTPLTSMYVINELLLDVDDNDMKKELLLKNKSQLERIEWLVTSILKISRLDSGMEVLKSDKVNIQNLIESSLGPIKIPLELKNIDVEVKCSNKLTYNLDFNWTREALLNILKNGCEHTPANGKIIVECLDNPLYLEIKITDNGDGIPKEVIPHIFERFYKGKHNKESIGIGLNMSKKIINLQNGDITCKSNIKEGTSFIIKFYKKTI